MHTDLTIIGAGGHGRVVLDAALSGGKFGRIVVRDDDPGRRGELVEGCPVEGTVDEMGSEGRTFHVGIGANRVREAIGMRLLQNPDHIFASVIHPHSSISRTAEIHEGVFVAARAVLAPSSVIETGTIANHGCIVDHDCRVGPWVHLAPGSILGGGVTVGAFTLIGAGAVVLPGIRIGADVTIGAGAVVVRNVPDGHVMVGVPAERTRR